MNSPEPSAAPLTLALIVGSLRRDSTNRAVANALPELLPSNVELVELSIGDLPFFNEDVENEGDPASVVELKRIAGGADALLVVTPEYNRSMPGALKNAIDWLSRPFGAGPITGRSMMVVAGSPGGYGGLGVREAIASSAPVAGAVVHEPTFGIGGIFGKVADGRLTDDETRTDLAQALADFCAAVAAAKA